MLRSLLAHTALASLLLALPFAGVGWASAACVPRLSCRVAAVLLRLTAPLASLEPASEPSPRVEAPPNVDNAFEPVVLTAAPRRPAKGKRAPAPGALFVSQATVLALSRTAARPQGSFVGETPEHPAGLLLSGVSALGIGVSDGDILTEALGVTPRSAGQIIALVLEARARKAHFLTGMLWRRGQVLRITVEQPYLPGEQPS